MDREPALPRVARLSRLGRGVRWGGVEVGRDQVGVEIHWNVTVAGNDPQSFADGSHNSLWHLCSSADLLHGETLAGELHESIPLYMAFRPRGQPSPHASSGFDHTRRDRNPVLWFGRDRTSLIGAKELPPCIHFSGFRRRDGEARGEGAQLRKAVLSQTGRLQRHLWDPLTDMDSGSAEGEFLCGYPGQETQCEFFWRL